MTRSTYTHASVLSKDLEESAAFYGEVLGMTRVATPNFSVPVVWMRCGDQQLHLFEREMLAPNYYHFGVHVDDFEDVYEAVREHDVASYDVLGGAGEAVTDDSPDVYELPDGSVQMYIRDPAENLVEVNYPAADELDRTVVTEVVDRDDMRSQSDEAADAVLYHDELLERIGRVPEST
jgi:catechol 2,3-dioxygenase-like lactoylglutathione lyase family enzyme